MSQFNNHDNRKEKPVLLAPLFLFNHKYCEPLEHALPQIILSLIPDDIKYKMG